MRNIYIHIGEGVVLKSKNVIGVFDMDTATVAKTTRDFLANAEKTGKAEALFPDLPRSFVVTDGKTYISALNPRAIVRRSVKNKIF